VKGFMDSPADLLKPVKPLLWIAGAGIAAVILIQVMPLFRRKNQ